MELFSRRYLLAGALALATPALGATLPAESFEVWRSGRRIGRRTIAFNGQGGDIEATIEDVIAVGLGPLILFRYHHQAREIWRGGAFSTLTSHTMTNGRREQVVAERTGAGVRVSGDKGAQWLPAEAAPLTHWNMAALKRPLFNPQTGAAMRERLVSSTPGRAQLAGGASLAATRCILSGEAAITDWYDQSGRWVGLRAKANDGSIVDYRRTA
ncbi:MAG TPA: DUF6134 family protein [Caulobacteraceae bacterium]